MDQPVAPNHKLALPHHVYLYDAEQPIGNPKPSWLLTARFNERGCAEMYVKAYQAKYPYAKHMKIEPLAATPASPEVQ